MDSTLQALERRWRQTGAADDEARWLQARLRAGDLARERLVLAADLGHAAAQLALDRPLDPEEGPLELLRGGDPSRRGLGRVGRAGLVRVALAAIEGHAELCERHVGPVHRAARDALAAVRAWCASCADEAGERRPSGPVDAHAARLAALQGGPSRPQRTAVLLARRLVEGVIADEPQASRALELALRIACDWSSLLEERRAPPPPSFVAELGGERPRDVYERWLLRRVQEQVVLWALSVR